MNKAKRTIHNLIRGRARCAFFTLVVAHGIFCSPPLASSQPFYTAPSLVNAAQQDQLPKKNVLVLFPYRADLPQTELATKAIRGAFKQATDLDIQLYVENMDLNRFSDEAYQAELAKLYRVKYSRSPIDLVLLTSAAALDFWLIHRDQIRPDVPGVVNDINSIDLSERQLPPDLTGVGLVNRYAESILWLMKALPKINEVILVHGVGAADQEFNFPVSSLKEDLDGQVVLTDWSHLPLSEIKQRAALLPPNAAIFYHLMLEDAAGIKHRPIDALRELAQVSSVPVLAAYDQFIGTGTVGGYVYSIAQHAGTACRMGLRILRGEAVGDIPVFIDPDNAFIFDHLALQRYNIPLSTLPPQSIIKNRQYSWWELYRRQVFAIVLGFAILFLTILLLIAINRKLKLTQQFLGRLNLDLEKRVRAHTATLTETNHLLEVEILERTQAQTQREALIADLQGALTKVKELEGILPICSFCKKIRDETDSWQVMETYISKHSEAKFSHGLCPDCAKKHYSDFLD